MAGPGHVGLCEPLPALWLLSQGDGKPLEDFQQRGDMLAFWF